MTLASEIIADHERSDRYRMEIMNQLYMMDVDQLKEARNAVNEIAGKDLIMKAETIDMLHKIDSKETMRQVFQFVKAGYNEDRQKSE